MDLNGKHGIWSIYTLKAFYTFKVIDEFQCVAKLLQPLPVLFCNHTRKTNLPYSTSLKVFNIPNKNKISFCVSGLRDYCVFVQTCMPHTKLRAVLSPLKKVL